MAAKITRVSSKCVYQSRWIEVYEDEIKLANGKPGIYNWVRRSPGVGALLYSSDGYVVLAKEWRYPVQEYSWEIPGGGIDDSENVLSALRREVKEEVGIDVEESQFVEQGVYYPLSSCSVESGDLFFAEVPEEVLAKAHVQDEEEGIAEVRMFSLDEAIAMVRRGEISDSFTGFALLLLWHTLHS